MIKQFDFEVEAPDKGRNSYPVTVRVNLTEGMDAAEVLQYLRSPQLKDDLKVGWIDKEAPNYGFAVRGGPVPVLVDPKDRSKGVKAYEQEFTLTRSL